MDKLQQSIDEAQKQFDRTLEPHWFWRTFRLPVKKAWWDFEWKVLHWLLKRKHLIAMDICLWQRQCLEREIKRIEECFNGLGG